MLGSVIGLITTSTKRGPPPPLAVVIAKLAGYLARLIVCFRLSRGCFVQLVLRVQAKKQAAFS